MISSTESVQSAALVGPEQNNTAMDCMILFPDRVGERVQSTTTATPRFQITVSSSQQYAALVSSLPWPNSELLSSQKVRQLFGEAGDNHNRGLGSRV